MHKFFLKIAALLAMLAVILGAFGAHALKALATDTVIAVFETGVRYQMYHAIGLFIVGILYKEYGSKILQWAGYLFVAGIVLFSGSLYLLTFIKAIDNASFLWVGAITPLGGACFIAGWGLIVTAIAKAR